MASSTSATTTSASTRSRSPRSAVRRALQLTALVAAVAVAVSAPAVQASSIAPVFVRTIGGPGHAAIYASGVDVDASGNVYVADTGNDQVKKYYAGGALAWNRGVRGQKGMGNFDNPRDIAYLGGKLYVADLGYKRVQ